MNSQQTRRNARVESHMRLVEPLARRYARTSGQDRDDLQQVGLLGLLRAAERYEGQRDVPFSAFARPHIRGAILHYLRDRASIIRLPRAVQNSAEDVGAGFNAASQQRRLLPLVDDLVSQDADHCRDLEQRENRLKLAEALQGLPSQERVALMEVILQGQSLRDVARRTGVSAMTIQRRVKRGLIRLRHQLTAQFELA
jgi:RNA polymerase sigma-B factor